MTDASSAITACIIARDEADNLRELLPTLAWADEVLVLVDEATRDDSAAVARSLGARVETRSIASFPFFRNAALDLANTPWVFFVDADERVSAALADEARTAVRTHVGQDGPVGFWVPRHNIMFGRLVRGGGWSPDFQPRLLRCDRVRFDERRLVHEVVVFHGRAGYLDERLLHLNYDALPAFFARQRRYTELEAQTLRAAGETFRGRALVGQPLREFARRYLALGGWRDGPLGLFLSAALAYYAFRRVKLVRALPAAAARPPT